ncbi:glycosyl transferase [Phycisphaerae bacterium]|nr:glycosyl transferase [Phycisphaerae bacterium]
MPILFVVIPVFNEPATLGDCVRKVAAVALPTAWTLRIVLINDGSDSATRFATEQLAAQFSNSLTLLHHPVNRGKGAALQTGFAHVVRTSNDERDAMIIQDADLEYDPNDFVHLIRAIESNATNCSAFGNRWHNGSVQPGAKGWLHMRANRLLTTLSNLATGLRVTDMECCYKIIPVEALRKILPLLTENRFGIEPQIAAALARTGVLVVEVPVSYSPRSFKEGKKIGPIDGFRALWVIFRSKFRV